MYNLTKKQRETKQSKRTRNEIQVKSSQAAFRWV